ncbi:MAG: patatin-like phospholipase family protein, partial [Dokdonella sp.]
MSQARTALVLSGGGSLGAVQVGMLQALSRANLEVDLIVGASVGALNGAFYADDPTPEGTDRLAELWRRLRRKDVFPLTLWSGIKALLLGRDHLIEPTRLRRIVRNTLHHARFEDLPLPLHVVATNVLSGQAV